MKPKDRYPSYYVIPPPRGGCGLKKINEQEVEPIPPDDEEE
jgi:hypothetical protein